MRVKVLAMVQQRVGILAFMVAQGLSQQTRSKQQLKFLHRNHRIRIDGVKLNLLIL